MPFDKKTVNDAMSVKGQLNTPVTKASQPTASEELSDQVQSVPLSEIEGSFFSISEDEILLTESIIAKPLYINDAYKIKSKDKHYAYYWGNWKAGGGLRYNQLIAMGFSNASEEDLLPKEQGGHQAQIDGGKLILGDVILMKMPRNKYLAHLKYNMQKSSSMLIPQKIHEQAKRIAGSIVTSGHGMPSMDRHKGDVFIPSSGEVRDTPVGSTGSAIEQRVFETVTRE
jgi:hypothetical protein